MFSNNRTEMRTIFFEAWRKYNEQSLLEELDKQIVNIILQHPEYHPLLAQPENYQAADFDENNPFMHLSLHLAIHEQLSTNRPQGIQDFFHHLTQKMGDLHKAEHQIMKSLGNFLWEAYQSGAMPNDEDYLEYLKQHC